MSNTQSSDVAKSGWKGSFLLNVLLIAVLVPATNVAMLHFVISPYIKSQISSVTSASDDADALTDNGDHAFSASFENVVTNVKGTMMRRYLQVSFTLRSANPDFAQKVELERDRLLSEATDQLCQLDLASLEQGEIRKVMQDRLKLGFNHILGNPLIEEINFTQFVVQ